MTSFAMASPDVSDGVRVSVLAATYESQIAFYGIGPTEIRIGYIALNTLVVFAGTRILGVPAVLALDGLAFTVLVVRTSRELWRVDYEANVDDAPR